MLKRYLFLIMLVCFAISTVSAEEISNETISYDSSLMADSVSEYNLNVILSDEETQGSADNGTFTDLQKNIDNADVGSTITLENDYEYDSGFPTEGISINKTLTINGNGHIIDALGQSRIFFINSTKVTLNNILFKNGNATDNGGAIYWYGDNGTINNCNFTNNIASLRAGAIYWYGVNGTINNSNFINNTAIKYSGGAIQWDYNSTNGTINNCNFTDNTGTQKGGAIYWYAVNGRMTHCNFTNNTSINGGAIYWDNNALYGAVDNSSFINNTGDDGGAIYWFGANGRMTNCIFTNNSGTNGGAINWQRTYGLVNNCNFTNNIATNGGAIYWEGTNGTENNCNFINNTAESNGGAIYWFGANGTISDSSFINNTADDGAIYWTGGDGTISDCIFINNNATTNGGAIYFNCVASLNNCALVNNIAPAGSEIYICGCNPNLNYNWWGSNDPNWANLINGSYVLSVYAVLNLTAEPSEIFSSEKSNITTKFVWNGTNTDATNLLPARNVKLTSNGTLTKNEGALGLTSEFSATTEGIYYVNATVDNEILGVNINVSAAPKKNLNISAAAEPIAVGENVTIIATGFENATGNVTARVRGGSCSSPIVNATATFIVSDVTSNTTASIFYGGDDNYCPANTTVNIIVYPKSDVNIVADNVTKYYGGPERFVANIYDSELNPIANKSVNITINGVTYTRSTDENGTAKLNINLGSGEYPVSVTVGDITVNSTVTVNSTIDATDVVKIFRNDTQYNAKFIDSNTNILAYTMVSFNINGIIYNRTTDGNGTAKLNINLDAGDYIITATNPVTGEMKSNTIKVISLIESNDLTKYYRNNTQFVVRIHSPDGGYLGAGEEIKFNINGVFYTRTTNATGHAKLNINLDQGNYTITTCYKDCSKGNDIEVLPILSANDLVMKYMDGSQFKAKLVDGNGNSYPKQIVKFNINGIIYNGETDSDGVAKLNINLMAGEYIITSSYNDFNIANKITIES